MRHVPGCVGGVVLAVGGMVLVAGGIVVENVDHGSSPLLAVTKS